jgi:hypothetical protein
MRIPGQETSKKPDVPETNDAADFWESDRFVMTSSFHLAHLSENFVVASEEIAEGEDKVEVTKFPFVSSPKRSKILFLLLFKKETLKFVALIFVVVDAVTASGMLKMLLEGRRFDDDDADCVEEERQFCA